MKHLEIIYKLWLITISIIVVVIVNDILMSAKFEVNFIFIITQD